MITLDTKLDVDEAFLSVDAADTYLENFTNWNAASDEDKEEALIAARYYIESKYDATIEGALPDELTYSNAILANDYVVDKTSFESTINIKSKKIKAGSVETSKEYLFGGSKEPNSWERVKAILAPIMASNQGAFRNLIRA